MVRKLVSIVLCCLLVLLATIPAFADTLFDQIAEETATSDGTVIINAGVNTMRPDSAIESMVNGIYCIMGSKFKRSEIEQIKFINNLEEMDLDAWDISELQNKTVYAWITDTTLFIGAEGVVVAPISCAYLFAFYSNLKSIDFNGNFDTSYTKDMTGMFAGCSSLEEIDLNSLDVSNVTSMASMFESCSSLKAVHASEWQTSASPDTTGIFNACTSLPYDTFDGIMFEKYEALEEEAAKSYPPMKVDDRNDDVADMQARLMALDYDSITKADGIYGKKTAAAVHAFKADNGIFDGTKHEETECTASGLMLEALYNMDIPGFEPKLPEVPMDLKIESDSKLESEELSDNQLKLNVGISCSSTQPVSAYTLSVYTTDSDGSQLSAPVSLEFKQEIEPDSSAKSGDIIIDERGKVANLYIGIEKIAYKDGTEISAPQVKYTCFSAVDWLE